MAYPQLTVTVDSLNSEGVGVARHEGKVYFIPWVVPGDTVLVQVEKEHPRYNEARLIHLVQKSPDHIDPRCPYFFECGGCQLQHINDTAQLLYKQNKVEAALKRIARIESCEVSPILAAPERWHYRRRIQLHVDRRGKIGFFKLNSHQIVEIDHCLIADESLNRQLSDLRKSQPEKGFYELRVDDSSGFIQNNEAQNKVLINLVLKFVEARTDETIFDLYCGAGNYTFPLARDCLKIYGVEKSTDSIRMAREESVRQSVSNIHWKQGGVFEILTRLQKEGISCDKMVVNPPREGIGEAMEALFKFHPQRIVYVSCNPSTFARDVARFARQGYRLVLCQPVDMFPQTIHVEVVGVLVSSSHEAGKNLSTLYGDIPSLEVPLRRKVF